MSDYGDLPVRFLDRCKQLGIMVTTAESCTGGMIVSALTDIAGSSAVVDRGYITYSNDAKIEMLGVSPLTLETHGAVSRETVLEMAAGALARSKAAVALAVTGIAGPDGGSAQKPVGLVWFGLAITGREPVAEQHVFENVSRAGVRSATVRQALQIGLDALLKP